MAGINWKAIGNQVFNVFDPNFGFWCDGGFTRDQHKATNYTQSNLTDKERQSIENDGCTLMSA